MTTAVLTIPPNRRVALAILCLALGAVAMGASPIFVRLAEVGPYASAFWRTFLALPFLFAWARVETHGQAQPLRFDSSIVLCGLLFAGDLFFWHLAILGTTVANATFLATTAPIWVVLGGFLLRSETIGLPILAGLALCLIGDGALIGESYGFAPHRQWGDLCGLATAVFFGLYVLACLLVVALVLEPRLVPASAGGLAALLALAVVSQVGGQGLVAVALGSLPATFSSLVIFLEAIAAAVFGWLILGEALGVAQIVGGALILLGIWVARPRAAAPAIGEVGP
jgi:drug/metabolite transporter (DMT)-like permease